MKLVTLVNVHLNHLLLRRETTMFQRPHSYTSISKTAQRSSTLKIVTTANPTTEPGQTPHCLRRLSYTRAASTVPWSLLPAMKSEVPAGSIDHVEDEEGLETLAYRKSQGSSWMMLGHVPPYLQEPSYRTGLQCRVAARMQQSRHLAIKG